MRWDLNGAVYLDVSPHTDVAAASVFAGSIYGLTDDLSQKGESRPSRGFCPTCYAQYTQQPDGTFVRVTDRSI